MPLSQNLQWKEKSVDKHSTYRHFFSDEFIQPASVKVIVLKWVSLQQHDKVLNGSAEITSDGQLFEGNHHVSDTEK